MAMPKHKANTKELSDNTVMSEAADAPFAVPHNIAISPNGKLYLTHSGMSDRVTVYRVKEGAPIPEYVDEVVAGLNPFGLAWIP